jgi:hypothetical protein
MKNQLYKRTCLIISCLAIGLAFTLPAWSLTINSAAIDVGSVDTLSFMAGLGNSGLDEEIDWVESVLGFDVTFDYKAESFTFVKTDLATGEIYATALQNSAEYYLIKTGNIKINPTNYSHFLFSNLDKLSYAVIDLADFGADPNNINIDKISHITAFNATSPAPVPEPATMVLFGVGLIGLAGISRKTNKIN